MSIAAAVYIYQGSIPDDVQSALGGIKNAQRIVGDARVCRAFQTARIPTLVLYNAAGEETARASGTLHIPELIKQTMTEAD